MSWKKLLDEAFQKGERVKEDLLVELVHSKLFNELVKNEKFIHAITTVIRTKDEISTIIHKQLNHVLELMDIPSRDELNKMSSKVTTLTQQLERVSQKSRLDAGKTAVSAARRVKAAKTPAKPVKKTATKRKTSKR